MRIAILGSRSYNAKNNGYIKRLIPKSCKTIISGGALGADQLAKRLAYELDIKYLEISPFYKKYGRLAPIIRNRLIVELSDLIIVLWDAKSKGTKEVIKYAKKTNTNLLIIPF